MKALIRLYSPPYRQAIEALEKIAVESPHICLMNPLLLHADPYTQAVDWVYNYFKGRGKVSYERCGNILAEEKELEGYDFVFMWMVEPTRGYVDELIKKIDDALLPLGTMYTLTTKKG
ncbi:MAG: hypothetical protein NTV61_05025 [Candidatus Bathyarchaeota archaeon]|nr:hypothetical protein [Candidatus Bathyarchaeota archaeon]